jgi:hypothetical protein
VAGWWVWGLSCWIGHGWCQNFERVADQVPCLTGATGVHRDVAGLVEWFQELAERLRRVRVVCGDWKRVLTPAVLGDRGPVGSHKERDPSCYAVETDCSGEVREWALEHGEKSALRIVLCGYGMEWKEFPA